MIAPELVVQGQLDAYNARDIDRFMALWADDCEYYAFPPQLLARGLDEVRRRHIERFEEPNRFGWLLGRMVVGNPLVDHETVTRMFHDGPGQVGVIAMYEIEAGRIARAWFRKGPVLSS